ncbi:UNVERIFIED_CONTAM: glycosyltransferase family 2 protein, partial [Prevotella sp. 15_C9]
IEEAGYENYYLPYPILHYKGESTSKDTYHHVRVFCGAMDIFFRKHGERYGLMGRWLVRVGIHLQMYIRLLMLSLRRIFSIPGKKAKVPFLKGQAFPRFLVFGEEATIHSLRGLFKRNGLIGKHHFVVANEASAADGHAGPF